MEKELFQQMLSEGLSAFGFLKDGKPAFVSAADFGKTAGLIGEIKRSLGGALTADNLVELGLFEKSDDGKLKLKAAPTPDPQKRGETGDDIEAKFKQMLEKQDAANKLELKKRDDALASERERLKASEAKRTVQEALTKAGALNPARDYIHLQGAVKHKDDGTIVAITKDKYDTEVEVSVDEFAKQWLETNPELKVTKAQSGSGATGGSSGQPLPGNVVPKAKLQDMGYYMANRDKILSGEIKVSA